MPALDRKLNILMALLFSSIIEGKLQRIPDNNDTAFIDNFSLPSCHIKSSPVRTVRRHGFTINIFDSDSNSSFSIAFYGLTFLQPMPILTDPIGVTIFM
jgi:hypothetical protein